MIQEQAINFIQQCQPEDNILKFPVGIQLDRDVYLEVKKRLEGIGGKWNRKHNGFVFKEQVTGLFDLVKSGEKVNLKKEFQAFFTPPHIADLIIQQANIQESDKVLEPSAGQGNLLKAIVTQPKLLECCEIQELNRNILIQRGYNVIHDDFMTLENREGFYNIIIANPPFTKNQDIDHIRKMYECLAQYGKIVSLSSMSWKTGNQKKQVEFKNWLYNSGEFEVSEHLIEAGEFKESGTMIASIMLTIQKLK